MRPPKYPLQPLAELRKKKVDDAASVAAAATRQHDAAARARLGAQRRCEDYDRVTVRAREAEGDALARGELRAVDLARADTWIVRVSAERTALAAGLEGAREAEAKAKAGESDAQAAVASCRAEAELIARHRADWNEAVRKRVEAKEEEASSEAWRRKK
jgi:hypothetical protein